MTRSYVYIRARPGRRDELIRALDRIEVLTAARKQPGFLAAEIQVRSGDDDNLLLWSSWASPEHHERWLANSAYVQLLRETADLRVDAPEVRVYQVVDAVQS